MTSSKYARRGVSASKDDVHKAVAHLDKGLFPRAFCKILPDYTGHDESWCTIMHSDTAGTKTSLAYLWWKETGDLSVWDGIIQDALVMNLDDMACAGARGPFVFSSTIGRNKRLIPGEVISRLVRAAGDLAKKLGDLGVEIHLAGGETADAGDIVRTIDVGFSAFTRLPRKNVIDIAIKPGDVIVGLASDGQAVYETGYNSGIGSNGLTMARHDVLGKFYAGQFPEAFDTGLEGEVVFTGKHLLADAEETTGIPVGKLLLSPTRTYAPVIFKVLEKLEGRISGIVHCTGGGQTKALKFSGDLHLIKDSLFDPPPVFHLIQQSSGTPWKEMYEVFNMGHRLEFYCRQETEQAVISIAADFGIAAKIIGRCEAGNRGLTIKTPRGEFFYR